MSGRPDFPTSGHPDVQVPHVRGYLLIHLEITEKSFVGLGGRRALADSQARLLARSALVRADFKFSEAPKALRAPIFGRLDRFRAQTCASEPPRDAPSLDVQGQDGRFFKIFACDERLTRKTSDIEKTL